MAFGMGIDIPHFRKVIGPPNDVEGYVQGTGYGGRDGLICVAILYRKRAKKLTGIRKITSPIQIYAEEIFFFKL